MKQSISRTIAFTTINFTLVEVKEGQPSLSEQMILKVAGKLNEKDATKVLQEKLPEKQFVILSLDTDSKTLEMSLDFFLENAVEVEAEQPKSKTEKDDK